MGTYSMGLYLSKALTKAIHYHLYNVSHKYCMPITANSWQGIATARGEVGEDVCYSVQVSVLAVCGCVREWVIPELFSIIRSLHVASTHTYPSMTTESCRNTNTYSQCCEYPIYSYTNFTLVIMWLDGLWGRSVTQLSHERTERIIIILKLRKRDLIAVLCLDR